MGRTASFTDADFLNAARSLAAEHGPAGVTVATVTGRLKAPTGSFYHRFASRDLLLGQLWLAAAHSFQGGFVALVDLGDGLRAALHSLDWAREHTDDARILLLHHRDDFIRGEWPEPLRDSMRAQIRQIEACLGGFARRQFGATSPATLRRAQFALLDLPAAAARPHLQRRERVPDIAYDLVRETYAALVPAVSAPARRRRSPTAP